MSFSPDYLLPELEDPPILRASEIFPDEIIDWYKNWKRDKDNSDKEYQR